MTTMTLTLEDELVARMRERAKILGISIEELATQLIIQYLDSLDDSKSTNDQLDYSS